VARKELLVSEKEAVRAKDALSIRRRMLGLQLRLPRHTGRVGGAGRVQLPTFARGTEQAGDSFGILDMTALGRQEDWEIPKGRSDSSRGPIPDFS
jgi:predicted dithiol-disulfide oxidoreductase (DUF899 family)